MIRLKKLYFIAIFSLFIISCESDNQLQESTTPTTINLSNDLINSLKNYLTINNQQDYRKLNDLIFCSTTPGSNFSITAIYFTLDNKDKTISKLYNTTPQNLEETIQIAITEESNTNNQTYNLNDFSLYAVKAQIVESDTEFIINNDPANILQQTIEQCILASIIIEDPIDLTFVQEQLANCQNSMVNYTFLNDSLTTDYPIYQANSSSLAEEVSATANQINGNGGNVSQEQVKILSLLAEFNNQQVSLNKYLEMIDYMDNCEMDTSPSCPRIVYPITLVVFTQNNGNNIITINDDLAFLNYLNNINLPTSIVFPITIDLDYGNRIEVDSEAQLMPYLNQVCTEQQGI